MDWRKCRVFQEDKARELRLREPDSFQPRLFLALDVSYIRGRAFTAALLFDALSGETVAKRTLVSPMMIPYVPTFLSFREIPPLLKLLASWTVSYDCLLCDGQGVMHPRRFGLASHLGWLLKKPSVGIAKSPLYGSFSEPGPGKGDLSPVTDPDGTLLGYAYRNRAGTKPVFVSPGYDISFEKTLDVVRMVSGRYRVPLPLHRADRLSKEIRKGELWLYD